MVVTSVGRLSPIGFAGGCGNTTETRDTSPETAVKPEMTQPVTTAPVAATEYGKIRGAVEDDILVFKGIRYGADTATTRFMPPERPVAWTDVKDTLSYGNSTRQRSGASSIVKHPRRERSASVFNLPVVVNRANI